MSSGHEATGCSVFGQGCGLSSGGLGRGLGLLPTPNPIRKGDGMQVTERAQPLADGGRSLASRASSWGKTYPLVFYKYGAAPVGFIIQFHSKIREKRRERESQPRDRPEKGRSWWFCVSGKENGLGKRRQCGYEYPRHIERSGEGLQSRGSVR